MKSITAILFSAAVLSPLAYADSNWYGVVSMGQSKFDASKSDADGSLRDEGLTVDSSKLDQKDTGFKFQAGYQFNPNLAVEGGVVDLGRVNYKANVSSGAANGSAAFKAHAYGLNVDAVGVLPLGADFSLFAKAGVILARVETDTNLTGPGGSFSDDSSKNSLKPTFGAGAAYALSEKLSVRVEFERFANLKDGDGGESNVDLTSIGLVAKF